MSARLFDKLWFFECFIPFLSILDIARFERSLTLTSTPTSVGCTSTTVIEVLKSVYKSRRHELLDSIHTLQSVNDECLRWITMREFYCTQLDLSRCYTYTVAGLEALLIPMAFRLKKLKIMNSDLNDVTELLSSDLLSEELEELVLFVYIDGSYNFKNYKKLHTVVIDLDENDSSNFVRFPTSLKHLTILNTKMYLTGINELTQLQSLDLSLCCISNDDDLSKNLKRLTSLTELKINMGHEDQYGNDNEDDDFITSILWFPRSLIDLTILNAWISLKGINEFTQLEILDVISCREVDEPAW